MKKLIALLLALVMVLSLAACGNKNGENNAEEPTTEVTEEVTEPEVPAPGSALEVLETIWALYDDSEKFPVMGGDANNIVDGAPGAFSLDDQEMLTFQLLVPADQAGNIDEAASLIHGMMVNNFTCGVFHVTGDADAFAEAMYNAVKNNQWMCGFPETMLISVIGGEYVLMAFGINDAMNPLSEKLVEAYPAAEIVYNESVV